MCSHHSSDLDGGHPRISRRDAIAGAGGVALLFTGLAAAPGRGLLAAFGPDVAEAAATSCVMTPSKTEGPYFVDEQLDRSDIRANTVDGAVQAGVPLTIRMAVFDAAADCAPVAGATVDLWHANAAGRYSDEAANGTLGQNWLRGFQTTDADGMVEFTTIYPGWYTGRAVHIHFKVRADELEFTSQMFFTDALNTAVFTTRDPYRQRSPQTADTTDGEDGILGSDAATLTLSPVADGAGGYVADFSIGIQAGGSAPVEEPAGDTAVAAALIAAGMVRTRAGSRRLRLRVRAGEPVTLVAKLTRSGRTLATRRVQLATGRSTVKLAIPGGTRAGAARLKLTLADAAGNRKRYVRHVHVACRR